MVRVRVAGIRPRLEEVLRRTAKLRALHLIDHDGGHAGFSLGAPLLGADQASERLSRLRSAASRLNPLFPEDKIDPGAIKQIVEDDLDEELTSLFGMMDDVQALEEDIEAAETEIATLSSISELGIPLDLLHGRRTVDIIVGKAPAKAHPKISGALNSSIGDGVSLISKSQLLVIIVRSGQGGTASQIATARGFEAIPVPERSGDTDSVISSVNSEIESSKEKLRTLSDGIERWNHRHGPFIVSGVEHLECEVDILGAPVRLATTPHSFIIDAWVPKTLADDVQDTLLAEGGASYSEVEEWHPSHGGHDEAHETPPSAWADHGAAKPLRFVTELVGRPKYGTIDPTAFMLFTYPLIFGMMLGDIGYGLIVLGVGFLLRSKVSEDSMGDYGARLLIYIGMSTMIFGLIYGEIFGWEVAPSYHHGGGHGEAEGHAVPFLFQWMAKLYPADHALHSPTIFGVYLAYPFHRVSSDMSTLMVLTIYLGVAHLMLGFILGFINVQRAHGFAAALFEKGSWVVLLLGGFMFCYAFLNIPLHSDAGYVVLLEKMSMLGLILMGIGLPMLAVGLVIYEKMGGVGIIVAPIESFSLLSNSLSYVRIFAVGVVGVKIAEVGNQLLWPAIFDHIGLGTVSGVLLGFGALAMWLAVQTLAIILGILSPNIHAARLHMAEWMSKFYDSPGEPYEPYGREPTHIAT